MSSNDPLEYHASGRPGKIEVVPTKSLRTQRDLSLAYSPGVAEACRAIHADPQAVFDYTAKGNLVAVVTNGTAVLGLGNIGPEAGKPVMEGKANLFKKFADIDVFDIELDAQSVDEIVAAVKAIAPTFGGINLEDIRAPECFEVERRLVEELDIPVFHDDQHGTAIISAAALINAIELTDRAIEDTRLVFSGAGAAAIACAELYVSLGMKRENIVMFDRSGAVTADRDDLDPKKARFAANRPMGSLAEELDGADGFIGLSVGNVLKADMIRNMSPRPILFAMANPDPEIPYDVARAARPDAILATGRSDYPNQVNNVLGFPFVFRGALDCHARRVTQEMKVSATRALAALAREDVPDSVLRAYGVGHLRFGPDYIIPKPFDPRVLTWVAPAVAEAAEACGSARRPIADIEAYRNELRQFVERARGLMQPLINRARSCTPRKRIVFPEGENSTILRAAQVLVDEGICTPILLGKEWRVIKRAEEGNISLDGMMIQEVEASEIFDGYADSLWAQRQRKGMTRAGARAMLRDPTWFGAMMVREGLADGLVGGLDRPYRFTLGPCLRVLGSGGARVSGVYTMLFKDRFLFFGDCTVNVEPDAATLADIAINTAAVAATFGIEPRVALLSYSDFGENENHEQVKKIREAMAIVKERAPELMIDGEMQADTAVSQEKLDNFPFSTLNGPANVLVFPDLTSGNIAYKLLTNLTDCERLGPLLSGLSAPVNVLQNAVTVTDVVNSTVYTVTQAIDIEQSS